MADRRKGSNEIASDRRRGSDRRNSVRYGVRHVPVSYRWQQGEREGQGRAALLDVSSGGLAFLTEEALPGGAAVQVWLGNDSAGPVAEGSVVRVTKTRLFLRGPQVISLQFEETCPYEFFTKAIYPS